MIQAEKSKEITTYKSPNEVISKLKNSNDVSKPTKFIPRSPTMKVAPGKASTVDFQSIYILMFLLATYC